MYHERIQELDARYKDLQRRLDRLRTTDDLEAGLLDPIIREQRQVLTQLSELRRKQWEFDHDLFDLDEDR